MEKISIIVPSYNEEEAIPYFYKEIKSVFANMEQKLELIFVDDGSKDGTLGVIKGLSTDKCVKYISFSRNFGKESAMLAGLNLATGDYIAIMDCDLQDPPKLLPEMVSLIKKDNYDIIGTRRVTRKGEPPIRSFFARLFYKLINKISKVPMVDGARDFRLMTRQVVNSILSLKEINRYSKGLFSYVGFKTKWLEYENVKRVAGETKWSFFKLFFYAIEGIVAFSTVPLMTSVVMGLIFLLASFIMLIIFIINMVNSFINTILLISIIICFTGGIILICLGLISLYLSKMYLEIKNRPIYIIKETNME